MQKSIWGWREEDMCQKIENVILTEMKKRSRCENVELKRIYLGKSTAVNYCIKTFEKFLFAKVYEGMCDMRFQAIKYIYDKNVKLIKPYYDFQVSTEKRCMVLEWISGENVHINLENAERIVSILKELHSVQVPVKMPCNNMQEELEYYMRFIKNNLLSFKHKDEILDYLIQNIGLCRNVYAFTHMDVHIGNFIQCDGEIYLIDYENMSITDPWRDFVYAVFFHDPIEDAFWLWIIKRYFGDKIPENFWEIMKYYCYMQLLRMIICEYKKGSINKIEEIVSSIDRGFSLESDRPKWIIEYNI